MRTTTLAGPLGAAFTLVALGAGTAFAQVTPPPSAPVPPPPSLRPGTTGTDKANGAPATTGPATTAVKGANYDTHLPAPGRPRIQHAGVRRRAEDAA